MYLRSFLIGLGSYLHGISNLIYRRVGTGGTISSRYCYSVWLRHIVLAHKQGLTSHPRVVAELGPGDSIGTGLAALLCGVSNYYAFDKMKFVNIKRNLVLLDELIELFKQRAAIPDNSEFPQLKPDLDSYEFPSYLLEDSLFTSSLEPKRINSIKKNLHNLCGEVNTGANVSYFAPWQNNEVIKNNSVDMIYSQAVLEHVDDLKFTYETFYQWLKPTGFISHQIDFSSHNTARLWNGHWIYSDFIWNIYKGKRPYFINRYPYSVHIRKLNESGFNIVHQIKIMYQNILTKRKLAKKFKNLTEEDLTTAGVFIQAVKA